MLQIEILVAPRLEFLVGRDARMRVAGRAHRGVERHRVGIVLRAAAVEHRRQVGAAAEPRLGGDDEARVHVHGRHMRVVHVGDQRNARRPEPRILGGAGNLRAKLRRELAVHGGHVHADLLEHAPLHHRHHAAAAGRAAMIAAAPRRAHETASSLFAHARVRRQRILDRFERRADVVAQSFEPRAGAGLAICEQFGVHLRLRVNA